MKLYLTLYPGTIGTNKLGARLYPQKAKALESENSVDRREIKLKIQFKAFTLYNSHSGKWSVFLGLVAMAHSCCKRQQNLAVSCSWCRFFGAWKTQKEGARSFTPKFPKVTQGHVPCKEDPKHHCIELWEWVLSCNVDWRCWKGQEVRGIRSSWSQRENSCVRSYRAGRWGV